MFTNSTIDVEYFYKVVGIPPPGLRKVLKSDKNNALCGTQFALTM